MASIQSAQKYMNLMAEALQIVSKIIPQMFNQIFAAQEYEEISASVKAELDSYWSDDDDTLLNNIKNFLHTIQNEDNLNCRQIMAIAFCEWLDFRITYSRSELVGNGNRMYFSLFGLVPISANDYVTINSLNSNYEETGIWINPKFPIASPYIIRNEEIIKKDISNRDIFEGMNHSLNNCSYISYDSKNIVKNIIIPDTFLNQKEKTIFLSDFHQCPILKIYYALKIN